MNCISIYFPRQLYSYESLLDEEVLKIYDCYIVNPDFYTVKCMNDMILSFKYEEIWDKLEQFSHIPIWKNPKNPFDNLDCLYVLNGETKEECLINWANPSEKDKKILNLKN